jgi:hypothetical protein
MLHSFSIVQSIEHPKGALKCGAKAPLSDLESTIWLFNKAASCRRIPKRLRR